MANRNWLVLGCAALIILTLVGLLAVAKNDKSPFVGDGPRISLSGGEVQNISADSPFYIRHGWGGDRFPGSIPYYLEQEAGIATMGGALFELYIDGVKVHLSVMNTNADGPMGPGEPTQFRSWYIQFQPGDLAVGEHEMTGVWSARSPKSNINVLEAAGSIKISLVVEP